MDVFEIHILIWSVQYCRLPRASLNCWLYTLQGSADSNYSQPSSELSLDEDKEALRREKEAQALSQLDKARVSKSIIIKVVAYNSVPNRTTKLVYKERFRSCVKWAWSGWCAITCTISMCISSFVYLQNSTVLDKILNWETIIISVLTNKSQF